MMITVTKDSAELLAQIFPTLLIALVLEARTVKGQLKTAWGVTRFAVRVIAILASLTATFTCVLVATGTSGPSPAADWWATIGFWSMFSAFALFINGLLTREVDEA
ncbi:hypothetical protein [Arthrobacter sp. SX1312]|uniref:hypothetical protein n=1 Tax=Arthrobacter sp. SX1312 TaxID=2058896 RepID=UPI000CE31937|nr:hypothetical protein [Arthrobacter sp. SX1312]